MPYKTNLTLLDDLLTEVREELWDVQLEVFPDSVRTSLGDVLDLTYKQPRHLDAIMKAWTRDYANLYNTKAEEMVAYTQKFNDTIATYRLDLARSIILTLQYPQGIFYMCGKQHDGTYLYMGFRYGAEPSQYMSGFSL